MTDKQNPNQPEPDEVDHSDDLAAVRNEAKQRRLALRAVEIERDDLRAWREARERQDVEAMAADRLNDPADLWFATSLDAMRAEDGTIDLDRAAAEMDRLLSEKPHWTKSEPPSMPDLHQGVRLSVPEPPSFGQAVRKALRG